MTLQSQFPMIDHNSGTNNSGEIILFGVRVKVDPLRKSVSMNDLSQYEHVLQPATRNSSGNCSNLDSSVTVTADSGYASANDVIRNQSNSGRERKRGVPWTEDEHKLFLLGLEKVGKGDWRGISRKFVKTRTPTQVASHAQKYFLRRSNLNRRRRRTSLFDITTDSVATFSMEEEQVHEDNNRQPIQPPMQSSPQISLFPMTGLPVTVGQLPSSQSINNQIEAVTFSNCDLFNSVLPTPLSTRADSNLDQKRNKDSLSLSLSLNLSLSCDYYAISGFNNGDGMISVG